MSDPFDDLSPVDLADGIKPLAEHFPIAEIRLVVRHFGGTEIYIPETLSEGHELRVLGAELAARLCDAFGGERLNVPKGLLTPHAKRAHAIEMANRGIRMPDIARAVNLTERQVYKLLAGELKPRGRRRQVDPRQVDMLDWLDRD